MRVLISYENLVEYPRGGCIGAAYRQTRLSRSRGLCSARLSLLQDRQPPAKGLFIEPDNVIKRRLQQWISLDPHPWPFYRTRCGAVGRILRKYKRWKFAGITKLNSKSPPGGGLPTFPLMIFTKLASNSPIAIARTRAWINQRFNKRCKMRRRGAAEGENRARETGVTRWTNWEI
ncbi:hypothetical protein PUN28_001550 [Cardiocondyla obscurior]|uniref:Uncharacterized protein n=1 Tax=Cardiocondyla obscurior TaxID=286306 RepID=A0AAW2H5L4_9HYME